MALNPVDVRTTYLNQKLSATNSREDSNICNICALKNARVAGKKIFCKIFECDWGSKNKNSSFVKRLFPDLTSYPTPTNNPHVQHTLIPF